VGSGLLTEHAFIRETEQLQRAVDLQTEGTQRFDAKGGVVGELEQLDLGKSGQGFLQCCRLESLPF
jgi:hypothetical protein